MRLPLLLVGVACLVTLGMAQPDLVHRGAAITVKVPSYPEAQQALYQLVTKHQGTSADRNRQSSEKGRHNGWTRVRVPKANLDAFLADVRQLGKVYGETLSLEDRAEEYASLGKRAERLREHQRRLDGILRSTRRLRGGDILYVQERLFRASVDEDLLSQRRQTLAAATGTSSVIVDFFEPTPIKETPHGVLGHTKAAFTEALRGLAFGMLGSIGTLLYLALYVLFGAVVWRLFRRQFRAGYERIRTWMDPAWPNADTSGAEVKTKSEA